MAARKPARVAKTTAPTTKRYDGFTEAEKTAMKNRVKEMKATADKAALEREVLEKIAAMAPPDRALAERIHKIIKASAPALSPRLWYGMPAYTKDGKIVCHFKDAKKFSTRYATLGFSDEANLDEGNMWPTEYSVTKLTAADEARIVALVKKAVS